MEDVTRRAPKHPTTDSFAAPPAKPSLRDTLVRLRYRYWPDHLLGDPILAGPEIRVDDLHEGGGAEAAQQSAPGAGW